MQALSEIVSNQVQQTEATISQDLPWLERNKVYSNDPEAQRHNPPAPVKCEFCGKLRYHYGFPKPDRVFWVPVAMICTCPQAQKAEKDRIAEQEREKQAEVAREERERMFKIIGNSGIK